MQNSLAGELRLLLSIEEAKEHLNVSERTVRKLVASGDLKSIKVAGRRMIPRQAIEAFIAERLEQVA